MECRKIAWMVLSLTPERLRFVARPRRKSAASGVQQPAADWWGSRQGAVATAGGIRRVFLRGRENFLKRVLIHLGALNLSLVMRQLLGKGTPRSWQGYSAN